jgi:hypothetical protein
MGEMHTIEAIRVSQDGTSSVVARPSWRLDRRQMQRMIANLVSTGTFPGYWGPAFGAIRVLDPEGAEILRWDGHA